MHWLLQASFLASRLPDNLPPRASLQEIREGWRFETSDFDPTWALLAMASLLGVLLVWSMARRMLAGLRPPSWAFIKAARKAGLSHGDAWLLWRIARSEKLPSGLSLMLSCGTLRHHGLRYLRDIDAARRPAVAQRLADIEARLFDIAAGEDRRVAPPSRGRGRAA
jgi:hypothetical protein